jgi:MFS family permease
MGAVTSVGFLFSPTIGGIIADRWGIRSVLWIASVLFLVSTVLMLRLERSGPGTMPVPGSGRLTRADLAPVAPALLIYMGVTFMILVTVPFLPPYLRETRGISLSEIGLLNSLQALGAVVLTPIAGRLGDRFGHAPTMVGQIGLWTSGIVMTAYGPNALLAPGAVLRCRSPLSTLAQAMVGGAAPPAALGRMFALAGMLSAVLSAVGSFVGGYAFRADPVYPLLISVATGAVLVVALLVRFGRR